MGIENAISLFKKASTEVPAYTSFLEEKKFDPNSVKNRLDFEKIPMMDKVSYLKKFPLPDLVPSGIIPPMISASSGSSGKPFYWPRGDDQEKVGALLHKRILTEIFGVKKETKILAIVCFSMGNWIAGTYTMASLRELVRSENFKISTITPGIDKDDIFSILEDLAPQFDMVILAGYPPFMMDVVIGAKEKGIDIAGLNPYYILAGENFSEKWRSLLLKNSGLENDLHRAVAIYGTADAGAIGHETPLSIWIRKKASEDPLFADTFFNDVSFIPTIVSYDPNSIFFESFEGELVFTTNSGIPLIRYNIKDKGVLFTTDSIKEKLEKLGILNECPVPMDEPYPMVALLGRTDVAVTFYALNIYPENLKAGLEDRRVESYVTGKYRAFSEHTDDLTKQKLVIYVELKPAVSQERDLLQFVKDSIFENLLTLNTEYRKLYRSIGDQALPEVHLLPYGDNRFVIHKSKLRWIE